MKGHFPNDSAMAIIQASAFYDHNLFGTSENPDKASCGPGKNLTVSNSSSGSSPSSSNSNGLTCQATANYGLSEEGHSLISFKPEFGDLVHGNGGILSFEQSRRDMHGCLFTQKMREEEQQQEEYPIWEENLHHSSGFHNQLTNPKYTYTADGRPETCRSHRGGGISEYGSGEGRFSFLNVQEGCVMDDGVMGRQEDSNNKRPLMGESEQAPKKQSPASKKPKLKPASVPLKDLQSVAAKNRRERISERLKILQDLVPNGSKVDLVTMLEKAISYVKFLQLQVKVLATDEFWPPSQGGKAPDLGQVREAIDAILASNRDRISSSSSK